MVRRNPIDRNEGFSCECCGKKVEPILYGGSNRNHCPFCLYSKHVDAITPGDRAGDCCGLMEPVSVFSRRTGEHVLVHRCLSCRTLRYNRIAGDDDFEKIVELSTRPNPKT